MFWFAGCIVVLGLCWFYAIKRGQKAVRAYVFITYRRNNSTVEEANKFAMNLSISQAARLRGGALLLARYDFEGLQLSMIAAAKADGFLG